MIFYRDEHAKPFVCAPVHDAITIQNFHAGLPGFQATPMTFFQDIAVELGVGGIALKDEGDRMGLSSFKILGASWGAYRAIIQRLQMTLDVSLDSVRKAAQKEQIILYAATDGNHGRAVARMATILGVESVIFVPVNYIEGTTIRRIRAEGAQVRLSQSAYDEMVMEAYAASKMAGLGAVFVQDTSFPGYEDIPRWIVDGYSTMLAEVERDLAAWNVKATHIITPVGVGSLANAVVVHCKSLNRNISVITVEPETAACLQHALSVGTPSPISTSRSIMEGLSCGTVSNVSWPFLHKGVDISVTVSDLESHQAVQQLADLGFPVGPCSGAVLAALQKLVRENNSRPVFDNKSIIVLLATEGAREYQIPS